MIHVLQKCNKTGLFGCKNGPDVLQKCGIRSLGPIGLSLLECFIFPLNMKSTGDKFSSSGLGERR